MTKKFKISIFIIALAVCAYFAYDVLSAFYQSHSFDTDVCKNYIGFFTDSAKSRLYSDLSFSLVNKRDIYNHFLFKDTVFRFTIWEFKDLANIDLGGISIDKFGDFNVANFKGGEILNSDSYLVEIVK